MPVLSVTDAEGNVTEYDNVETFVRETSLYKSLLQESMKRKATINELKEQLPKENEEKVVTPPTPPIDIESLRKQVEADITTNVMNTLANREVERQERQKKTTDFLTTNALNPSLAPLVTDMLERGLDITKYVEALRIKPNVDPTPTMGNGEMSDEDFSKLLDKEVFGI
jgi:hypothetical protein